MVEHEVSVETTQIESETVTFCDFCGEPEDTAANIETLFTASHGPQIIRESRNAQSHVVAWQPGRNPDRRESLNVTGRTGERLYVEYDVDGLAAACEACRERLAEGEIPNPGTIHRDRTDTRDVRETPDTLPDSSGTRIGTTFSLPSIPWKAAVGLAIGACVALFFLAAIADLPGVALVGAFGAIAMLCAAAMYGVPEGNIP